MNEELMRYLQATEERLGQRLENRIAELEERIIGYMRDMQTELLKGYLSAQEQARARDNALEARTVALETRAATVENRLAEIEKKLLLNLPAA